MGDVAAQSADAGATDPTPAQLREQRQAERRARRAELQRLRREKQTARKARVKTGGRRAEAAFGVSPEPTGDPVVDARDAFIREQLHAPLSSPEDLARVLGRIQMSLYGLAQGTPWETPAMALQWTDGMKPTPTCISGCRFLWPWLEGRGYVVKLAEQGDTILAFIGLVILVGPAIRPAIDAARKSRALAAAKARGAKAKTVEARTADQVDQADKVDQADQIRAAA